MLFSISEFGEMCELPAQTLRFYHAEGLLVPASVDAQTGYRSYAYEQVEQAVLIVTLRQAGLSVRDVRQALDDLDHARTMLQDHVQALAQRRRREDRAVDEAGSLLTSWPEVQAVGYPGQVVLSTPVPHWDPETWTGPAADERWYDWDRVEQSFHHTVGQLAEVAAAHRLEVAGPAWMTIAAETRQQKIEAQSAAGPHWLAKLPGGVAAGTGLEGALPPRVELQTRPGRDELLIRMPGRTTMAKYAMALHRLVKHPVDGSFVDLGPGGERLVVHEDAFEFFVGLCPLDDTDEDGDASPGEWSG